MKTGKPAPEIEAVLKGLQARGAPPVHTLSPEEARRTRNPVFVELGGGPEAVFSVKDMAIGGPGGAIPVRVYVPEGEAPFPALVFYHGGGWVICNLDTHDSLCRALANRAGAVVISVDYRLAPENKFPAAVEDAYAAVRWVAEKHDTLSIDPSRIAVGGDSAGGNLAAVVCHMARDRGGPALAYQLLVYPVTDLSSFDRDSYRLHGTGYILTADSMAYYRSHYLRSEKDGLNPLASPLLAQDLTGLPPAMVITAELDVLTDEGKAYAERLGQAGVPVKSVCFEGMIHAFFSMSGVAEGAREAVRQAAAELRASFATPNPGG
jgi:acetyl esterase